MSTQPLPNDYDFEATSQVDESLETNANEVELERQNDVLPVTVDPVTEEIVITDGDTEYRITDKEVEDALESNLEEPSATSYEDNAFIGSEFDLIEQEQRRKIAEEKAINAQSALGKSLQAEHDEMLNVHNKFISKRDHADYLFWQEVKRKGQIVRKDFKMGEEVADAAKAAGLDYKESVLPFNKSFKATDSTGKVAINYSGSKATFHNDYALDPATIKAGCLAVKKSGLKKPCIFAPSHMNAQQKTEFYSLCFENLLLAGYEPTKIKFDNPAFEAKIREKYAGFKAHGGIGDADSVEMTDGLTGGKGLNIKPEATADEKKMTDAAYALFQAADAASNRIKANTAWSQFRLGVETIDKNAVKQINNVANGKETADIEFLKKFREDKSIVESFKKLSKELDNFKEVYGSGENAPEKYKDTFRAVEMLQKYGFNPDSKNKTFDFWNGGDAATETLKKMSAGLKGVTALINEQNNYNFATLDKNDMSDIKRRSGVMAKFKAQIEQGDASSASNYSNVVKGSELNAVSNKNSTSSKMFPDTANVYKFNMSGEGVDLYFYAGKNGMEMIAGSGNKYSKPQRANVSANELVQMLKMTEGNTHKTDVKEEVKQDANPVPKDDVIDELQKEFMTPDELKDLANGKKPDVAKEAPQADSEHVPVIDKFTIQSGMKTFDMEFKDGIANHAGVAYVLKKYAGDVDKTVEGILEKNEKVLAIKVLNTLPMDASCLIEADVAYETREKPVLVDNMYCIPGVTGHLIYELRNHDGKNKHTLGERMELAAEAAGITVDKVNGVFMTDVHSYSLNEIKMSEVEDIDYSNKQGYYTLKDLQKELRREPKKVVGINQDVDVAETAKNAPATKGADFVDTDPTDNVEGMKGQAPKSFKAEDAADYVADDDLEIDGPDDSSGTGPKRRKPKYK
ncbi:hypothetical protein [Pseudomonas sp. HY7a-MNA-CIBAN-0227]|uniref:hypothetical protein n=1 Tax=Pseudomonas sp. HY7a-MNA-CIBAN-0227 TaxID=3140474 RepID=UPI00332EEBDE